MNHATAHHTGSYQHPQKSNTTEVVRKVGRLRRTDAKHKGRPRGAKGQKEVGTGQPVANGFLGTTFLPRPTELQTVRATKGIQKVERDFYLSLSRLAGHYGIELMQTQHYGYPYNMALALWDVETRLKRTVRNWERLRYVKDGKKTYFISEERYSTGTTLYYIPVLPLCHMLKDPKRKRNAHLLLSVCAYLYRHAGVPYYTTEDSYLYWQYEMLDEWAEQDEYGEVSERYWSELRQAWGIGDRMGQKIGNLANLEVFGKRLEGFRCVDAFEADCLKVARKAYLLYHRYPNERIFRHAESLAQQDDDVYCQDEVIAMDKYISFFASGVGYLYDSLSSVVNEEFNEYGGVQEPCILKRFDGSKVLESNLDFEERLFGVISDLCSILNNYKRK